MKARTRTRVAASAIVAWLAAPGPAFSQELDRLLDAESPAGNGAEAGSEPEAASAGNEPEAAPPKKAPPRRVVEEIVVTAQKREQSLRDVPISISVLDGDFIVDQGITDFRDLSLYVGNVNINPNGRFPDARIRGFGSPWSSKAFEQSVGLALDGVAYTRLEYFQGALFDVERIEVLRGPQGTLFGKNTTAGLLSVVTRNPTDHFTGYVDVSLGELDARRFAGAISGPLVEDWLNFRIAAVSDERDGYVENTTAAIVPEAHERLLGRERKGLRVKLDAPDLAGVGVVLSYEHWEADLIGSGWEITHIDNPVLLAYLRQFDPNLDIEPGNWRGSLEVPEQWHRNADTFVATARTDLAGWGLTGVVGHSFLDNAGISDAGRGPAPMGTQDPTLDENPQTSVELRASSPNLAGFLGLVRPFGIDLGTSEVTGGFFWETRDLDSFTDTNFNFPVLVALTALDRATSPPLPPVPVLPPLLPVAPSSNSHMIQTFFQQTRSLAGFGQLGWHFRDRWTLELGARLTHESKEADWTRTFDSAQSEALWTAVNFAGFTEHKERSSLAFTPKVSLLWDWTDDVNFFVTRAIGFKSGGFNENPVDAESLEYDDERAESWELGTKTRFLDGTLSLDAQLFWMEVEDLQVFTTQVGVVAPGESIIQASVENAGEARARGIEVETTWLPADWLTLRGSLSYNDTEYLSFPFGSCPAGRSDTDGDGDARCDLTGQPLERAPKWSSAVTTAMRFPVASIPGASRGPSFVSAGGLDLVGGWSVLHEDVRYADKGYSEFGRQPTSIKLDARIGLRHEAQGWELTLNGANLTNEDTFVISESDVGGYQTAIYEPPRLFSGSLRWSF